MNKANRAAIEAHAIGEYPREACGLLVRAGRKEIYVPCRNIASTPNEHFRLAPEDYAAAEDRGDDAEREKLGRWGEINRV
jgi:proteasome lid subunit RPN8/RPN11